MSIAHSKITTQGQISVPAEVRKKLGVGPGSILEWIESNDQVVVRRAEQHTSIDIHEALFAEERPKVSIGMKDGIRKHLRKKHARRCPTLLVRDDAAQVSAAEAFGENGAWVSRLVLFETLRVLDAVYERAAAQIAKAIELLLNHNSLTLQDADVVAAALVSFQARRPLGFSDCMVLEIARKAGHLPLGTFDKGLAKLADVCRL